MNVLVVIDMQKALFETPRFKQDLVISHINQLIDATRSSGGKVIHVQHNGDAAEGLEEGSEGWQIHADIAQQVTDTFVHKTLCDAFYKTNLLNQILALDAQRVIFCGAATDFCVDTTVRSAVSHQLPVIVAADAHTTGDRPHLNADAIVEHHNWVWTNLITSESEIVVADTKTIIANYLSNI